MNHSEIPTLLPRTGATVGNAEVTLSQHAGGTKRTLGRSRTRREISRHVASVVEKVAAWSIPGEDERDRDYVRQRFLDLKELSRFIEVVLADRKQNQGGGYKVLDVGTCLGILPLTLRSMGIDASACDHPRFEVYREWLEREGVPYLSFDLKDGDLPYASGSFDAVTFKQVIEHLPFSPGPTLRSFYRILRPGGVLLLSTPNIARLSSVVRLALRRSIHAPLEHFFDSGFSFTGHYREYTMSEIKSMLVWCGFEVKRSTYMQQHDVLFLLRQRKRFKENLFGPIRWKEILTLTAWRPLTFLTPSLSQYIFVAAQKPAS